MTKNIRSIARFLFAWCVLGEAEWVGLESMVHADVFRMPKNLRSLEMVTVGDPGNSADRNGLGAVGYPFKIAKFEVTTAQYVEFLNAKGKSTPDGGLWSNDMSFVSSGEGVRCGIERQGEEGQYTYHIDADRVNRPVTHVSFWDACRFCNWLHNGQGDGDTETGAYTLKGYGGTDGRRLRRNTGAKWFIPNEDEWYKAAYYDPHKSGGKGYWDYPTRSDAKPNRDRNGSNAANFFDGGRLDEKYFFTEVGTFTKSAGPHGTFDQAGNVFEWTEALDPPLLRIFWGGSLSTSDAGINVRPANTYFSSRSDVPDIGFRVASAMPGGATVPVADDEPKAGLTVSTRPFPRRPWFDPQTGKPFLPLAWFTWTSDEADLDAMAEEGVNLVLFVEAFNNIDSDALLSESIQRMTAYLDHAQKKGIRVLPQIGGWYGAHMRQDQAEIERQRQWVTAISKHPALVGYQLYDEPEYREGGGLGDDEKRKLAEFVDGLAKTRQAMRTWDPNEKHIFSVVFNLVPLSSWTSYLPIADTFQIDRYPCDANQSYFGHTGDWGPLIMAWSIAHGADAMHDHSHLHNPSPCMQGVGLSHTEVGQLGVWRNPLYEETRYMAYSSLTTGGWGVYHWIRNPSAPEIRQNVARLYKELRQLIPAFERSYQSPPFTVDHNHQAITRDFLTDSVEDITTLALEDDTNYYLIVSDNSGLFKDVLLRMKLPRIQDRGDRQASVLNEGWSRTLTFDESTGEWMLPKHTMCFGDVNVWVIPKAEPVP